MRSAKKGQAQQNKPRKNGKIYPFMKIKFTYVNIALYRKLAIHGESQDVEVVKSEANDDKRVYSATYHTGGHGHSTKGERKEVPFVFEVRLQYPSFRYNNLPKTTFHNSK